VKAYVMIKDLTDEEFLANHFIIFCTKKGLIKKTPVDAFKRPRTNGIIAIGINEGDQLLEARLTNGNNEIVMSNRAGRAIRFPESKVRPMGRTATGVRGITLLSEEDRVIGMLSVDPTDENSTILVLSEKGFGKRSKLDAYRVTNRGGKGVRTINVTEKTGNLASIKYVTEEDDLMITNKSGIVIRISVADLRVAGRATQGVKVIRLDEGDEIADITVIGPSENEDTNTDPTAEGETGTAIDGVDSAENANEVSTAENETTSDAIVEGEETSEGDEGTDDAETNEDGDAEDV